jgi:hypothetical protein
LSLSAGAASAQTVYPGSTATQLRLRSTIVQLQPTLHRRGTDHWLTRHKSTHRLLPTQRRRRSPAITQRSQSWFRSRYMTTHPVIGGAKDTLLGNLPAREGGRVKSFLPPPGGAALAFGGFSDHPEKPHDSQCAACGRSFIGSGTERPRDWRPSTSSW